MSDQYTHCTLCQTSTHTLHCVRQVHTLYIMSDQYTHCTLCQTSTHTVHCVRPVHTLYIVSHHLHRQVNEVFIHLPMKMASTVISETSAIRTQTPEKYPKRNNLHLEHGESLKTRITFMKLILGTVIDATAV